MTEAKTLKQRARSTVEIVKDSKFGELMGLVKWVSVDDIKEWLEQKLEDRKTDLKKSAVTERWKDQRYDGVCNYLKKLLGELEEGEG